MSFVLHVLHALEDAEVPYVIVDGVAVLLHGVSRLTRDLDLVIDRAPERAAAAVKVRGGLDLRPLIPVDAGAFADAEQRRRWIAEKNLRVFTLHDPADPTRVVDLFVDPPSPIRSLPGPRCSCRWEGSRRASRASRTCCG